MIRFHSHPGAKYVALFLCFLLFGGSLPSNNKESKLEGPFNWAKKYYLEGKYREASRKLELLLSYIDEKNREFKGKVHLLLGASKEKMGKITGARKNYMEAKKVIGKQVIEIEGIDFSDLVEYQRIITGNDKPLMARVIEREARKPKKKQISPLLVIAGIAVVAGIAALFILKKKKSSGDDEIVPGESDYDTRELGITWVKIPAGEFMMGDNFNEGDNDELPVHAVNLDEYYISKYEITFEQYDKVHQEIGELPPPDEGWGRGSRPVIMVSWYEANAFCTWLSQKTGKDIHLPTEAQWEKAARGTGQRRYPWGNAAPDCSLANFCCKDRTDPVGSYPAGVSPYGVHDMAGNVAEWCRDKYRLDYYSTSPYRNPQGPYYDDLAIYRVVRGGSWDCNAEPGVRSADRIGRLADPAINQPVELYNHLGFRIVMESN